MRRRRRHYQAGGAVFSGPGIDPNADHISGAPYDPLREISGAQVPAYQSQTIQANDLSKERAKYGNLPEMLRRQQLSQQFPGYVPGSEFNVNFGLTPRQGDVEQRTGSLADLLAQAARGEGPSAAQTQFQGALDQSLRGGMALAQSTPGMAPGAALRAALESNATTAGQAAAASGTLRAQEMMGARGQLAGVLGQMGQLSEQDRQALMAMEQLRAGAWGTQLNADTAAKSGEMGILSKGIGGLLGGAGAAGAALAGGGTRPSGARGGRVVRARRGQRAEVRGDSENNDKVPAMLSEGEIVIPRSVAKAGDAPERARDFVAAIKKHYAKGGAAETGPSYGPILASLKRIEHRLAALGA